MVEPSMNDAVLRRIELENDLRKALEREEFIVHYQPKVDTSTREIKGCEALVRWQRSGKTLVPPDKFIPLAEETGLIVPLREWVLRRACKQAKEWLEELGFYKA
ncbi:MAG: EAL domain-containing protein [Proteobacteria bacterium]|nr:EAL domain-containing protein [Pseudomonadota bacterium]